MLLEVTGSYRSRGKGVQTGVTFGSIVQNVKEGHPLFRWERNVGCRISLRSSVGECQKVTFSVVKKVQRGDSPVLHRQRAFWCVSNKGPHTDQLPSNYKRKKNGFIELSLSVEQCDYRLNKKKFPGLYTKKFELNSVAFSAFLWPAISYMTIFTLFN